MKNLNRDNDTWITLKGTGESQKVAKEGSKCLIMFDFARQNALIYFHIKVQGLSGYGRSGI